MTRRLVPIAALAASMALLAGCLAPTQTAAPSSCDGVSAALLEILECGADPAAVEIASSRLSAPAPALANDVIPTVQQVFDFTEEIIVDADTMWQDYFAQSYPAFAAPQVEYSIIMPGFTHTSACIDFDDQLPVISGSHTPTAFYCPAGYSGQARQANGFPIGEIVLASETLQDVWRGKLLGRTLTVTGDFAVAFVAAHEFGHHIANELQQQSGIAAPVGKNNELLADCFAGVWAAHAYVEGMLEEGDIEEGLSAAQAVGDLEGQVTNDPHGTGAQRQAAFLLGYEGDAVYPAGAPDSCITAFWQ